MDSSDRPITLPNGDVSVSTTGAVSVGGQSVATLGISQGAFVKIGSNLYESTDASAASNATVRQGELEGSNVNAVTSMVDLIKISRLYDLTQRSITQQDQLSQQLISSLQQGA
jgi:flagellar basal body rod protein FlgG